MTKLSRAASTTAWSLPQRVDFEHSLHLGEEPIQEAEVPARNSDDGRYGIISPRLRGRIHISRRSALIQQLADLGRTQCAKLMHDPIRE
jgi:hypothetical protein